MFVFAMAGLSSRFSRAGYTRPKFELVAHGHTLFEHSVIGFRSYFERERFTFVTLASYRAYDFIAARCREMGLPVANTVIIELDTPTDGQAETVAIGIDRSRTEDGEPITIFNIDTFRPDFHHPITFDFSKVDGYLETFEAAGDHWSFVRSVDDIDPDLRVVEVAEKKRISRHCSTGLYYFRTARLFRQAFETTRNIDSRQLQAGERFVAPLYNILIQEGRDIRYAPIRPDQIIQCGTPEEYQAVLTLHSLSTSAFFPQHPLRF